MNNITARRALIAVLVLFAAVPVFAGYPEFDSFDRGSIGTYWTASGANFGISANRLWAQGADTNQVLLWTKDAAPGNDQFSEVVATNVAAEWINRTGGVAVRMDTSRNGYACVAAFTSGSNFVLRIEKWVGGTATQLGADSAAGAIADNDRVRLEVSGTSLTCRVYQGLTGVTERIAAITRTDATYASGRVGVARRTQNMLFEDWCGGGIADGSCSRVPSGTQLYISTTGSWAGTGAAASPLPFYFWVAKCAAVGAGKTFWLRAGTYTFDPQRVVDDANQRMMPISCAGSSGSPVDVRVYPGESAIIDAAADPTGTYGGTVVYKMLVNQGTYTRLYGLKLTNSNTSKILCGNHQRPYGYEDRGTGNELHFTEIYDMGQAMTLQGSAVGTVINGIIAYNNGQNEPSGVYGHNAYVENDSATRKTIQKSLFLNHANNATRGGGQCVQFFSASGAPVRNVTWDRNTCFNTYGMTSASSNLAGNIVSNSRAYANRTGFEWQTDAVTTDVQITGNHFIGSLSLNRICGGTMTNNIFGAESNIAQDTRFFIFNYDAGASCDTTGEAFTSINNNTYYSPRTESSTPFAYRIIGSSQTQVTFTNWKAQTGSPDAASTFDSTHYPAFGTSPGASGSTNYVYEDTFTEEPGRAHVTVFNYQNLSSVSYTPTVLNSGDYYAVYDAQCLGCGAIATGQWTSGTISLDMTRSTVTVPTGNYDANPGQVCNGTPSGNATPTVVHSAQTFGTFILRRQQVYRSSGTEVTAGKEWAADTYTIEWGYATSALDGPKESKACGNGTVCRFSVPQAIGTAWYRVRNSSNALMPGSYKVRAN